METDVKHNKSIDIWYPTEFLIWFSKFAPPNMERDKVYKCWKKNFKQ
jgi:hypothetical protein